MTDELKSEAAFALDAAEGDALEIARQIADDIEHDRRRRRRQGRKGVTITISAAKLRTIELFAADRLFPPEEWDMATSDEVASSADDA